MHLRSFYNFLSFSTTEHFAGFEPQIPVVEAIDEAPTAGVRTESEGGLGRLHQLQQRRRRKRQEREKRRRRWWHQEHRRRCSDPRLVRRAAGRV